VSNTLQNYLRNETLLHVVQTRVTAWTCPSSGMTPYTFVYGVSHTSATGVSVKQERNSCSPVSVHKTGRKHAVRNGYRFKSEDAKYFTDNCHHIFIRDSVTHLNWGYTLLFELYGIPGIIFYISLFISAYFSHGAVITCFTRFQVLTVVQLGIPFFSDVIHADGWVLTLVSPSLSIKPQVLRVLSNEHQLL
jgi:hypothetical protein